MKRQLTWLLNFSIMISVALLAGCQTIEGMGKDVENGGKAISKAAGRDDRVN